MPTFARILVVAFVLLSWSVVRPVHADSIRSADHHGELDSMRAVVAMGDFDRGDRHDTDFDDLPQSIFRSSANTFAFHRHGRFFEFEDMPTAINSSPAPGDPAPIGTPETGTGVALLLGLSAIVLFGPFRRFRA